jgi:hypothetical protein
MMSTAGVAARIRRSLDHRVAVIESWLFEDKHALYGVALARILSGCAVLGILVTNFRVRNVVFGPGSVWNDPLDNDAEHWPPHLVENLGSTTFLLYYLGVVALAVCWTVGWHTRPVGLLMLIGEVSIIERAPLVGDQGDNILRIGLVLLMFMQAGEHWSLDARRRGRTTVRPVTRDAGIRLVVSFVKDLWNGQRALPLWLTNGVHNLFLLLLNTTTRRLAIGLVMVMHLSIALVMALPWFSLSMLAFDSIFVSTATYQAIERWIRRVPVVSDAA